MINLIKLCFSVGLLWVAFRMVDISQVLPLLSHSEMVFILFGVLFQLLSTSLAAYRWSLIMGSLQFEKPFSFYLRSYFKGSFFNQALPGSIGGDAVRVLELGKHGYSKKEALAGVFIDRVVGLSGLLMLNLAANMFSREILPLWLYHLINIICVTGIVGFLVLIGLHKLSWLHMYRVTRMFSSLSERFRQVYSNRKSIIDQIGLSIVIHFLSIMAFYELARSVGMTLPLSLFLVVVPPVFLLTILPISLAGWGVRESAMVGIFLLVGASKEMILAVSILYGITLIVASIPGLVVWLRGKQFV